MSQIKPHITIYREDFVDHKFPPHGNVKQSLMGQIIVNEANEPFKKTAPLYMQAKAAGEVCHFVSTQWQHDDGTKNNSAIYKARRQLGF